MTCIDRIVSALVAMALCVVAHAQDTPHYLVVNNNHPSGNFATFFTLKKDGTFADHKRIETGGKGGARIVDDVAQPGVAVFHSTAEDCAFISDSGTSDIAAIDSTLQVVGRFHGGPSDSGNYAGIALTINQNFLYAGFTGLDAPSEGRIASFKILAGCRLKFLGSVPATGLGVAPFPEGLATHGKILVVTYGDGFIESFHFLNGRAESNGDLQLSTGGASGYCPTSVDISQDGRFAAFGDDAQCSSRSGSVVAGIVEVADISSGKLNRPTSVYTEPKILSDYVRFSPDGSLLYLGAAFFGESGVGAAFFDKATGVVRLGCTTALRDPLEGQHGPEWWHTSGLAFANNASGNGGTVYFPENNLAPISGNDQYVGFVNVSSNGKSCSMKESPKSNFEMQSNSFDFGTVASWPPRSF